MITLNSEERKKLMNIAEHGEKGEKRLSAQLMLDILDGVTREEIINKFQITKYQLTNCEENFKHDRTLSTKMRFFRIRGILILSIIIFSLGIVASNIFEKRTIETIPLETVMPEVDTINSKYDYINKEKETTPCTPFISFCIQNKNDSYMEINKIETMVHEYEDLRRDVPVDESEMEDAEKALYYITSFGGEEGMKDTYYIGKESELNLEGDLSKITKSNGQVKISEHDSDKITVLMDIKDEGIYSVYYIVTYTYMGNEYTFQTQIYNFLYVNNPT